MEDRRPSVLVIDDDRSLLLGLQAILSRAGYGVLTASNGDEGLYLVEEKCPDVIVCDIMMPPPNGIEVRRSLARNPELNSIPFIFLTARVSQSDKVHGIDSGADDYITKPFDREEFLARIRAVLRRADLSRQQGRVEAEAQMEELRRVISRVVTQKLRTPVNRVLQAVEAVLSDKFDSDLARQQAFIQTALDNAYLLHDLIDDLLVLADLDEGRLGGPRQAIDLRSSFHDPVKRVKQRWEIRQVEITVDVQPDIALLVPAHGFSQAVCRLVDNALKFSPEGGEVNVTLAANGHGGCVLTVSDQGPGIPVELREEVFGRYYQGPRNDASLDEGLGVGLTVARMFARELGGDVVILDSADGCQVQMVIPPVPPAETVA